MNTANTHMPMEAEWTALLPHLRQVIGERNFATWIAPIRCRRDAHGVRLEVDNQFCQEWVTRHYMDAIRTAVAAHAPALGAVRVVVSSHEGTALPPQEAATSSPLPLTPTPRPTAAAVTPTQHISAAVPPKLKVGHLVPEYSFETFVVGEENEMAYRAARAVLQPTGPRSNPLFIWGGVGLGKTHLVTAVAHEALQQPKKCRVGALSAETFMNSLITALRQDKMGTFRDRFRALDLLIIDDIEFLARKERTQEEFFHTFNALHSAGSQVVITCDKPPEAIPGFEERLRSRFEGGMIAEICPPSLDMRMAIAIRKAAVHGVQLPQDIAQIIAQRSGSSVRELEGALTRVVAMATLQDRPVSFDIAQRVLKPLEEAGPSQVTISAVQEVVCQHFHITVADLQSRRRSRDLAFPRQLAMYLSRAVADASLGRIAREFGGRDHSTIIYAVRAVEKKRRSDAQVEQLLAALERRIRGEATA